MSVPTNAQITSALLTWTSSQISLSTNRLRSRQLIAAELLASVPGQTFPQLLFRALHVPGSDSFEDLAHRDIVDR